MKQYKRALILGGANTLNEDQEAALALFEPDVIIACNHAGRDTTLPLTAWCSMHPDIRDRLWIPARRKRGLPDASQLWHPRHRGKWPGSIPIESWGGSSGMLCIAVAFELECTHIVLAGVPMVKLNNHYDDPKPWFECRQYHSVWKKLQPKLQGRVKSMSGFTRELLGYPDERWINEVEIN